jgi:hypothetical protein
MKNVKIVFVERETMGRTWHGIDFGVGLEVLIRFGDRRVVWQKGHSCWMGGLTGSEYSPSQFVVLNPAGKKHGLNYEDIHKGRFSQKHFPVTAHRLSKYLDLPPTVGFKLNDAMYRAYKGGLTAVVTLVQA